MSNQDFYANLPVLTEFLDLANPDHYAQVPDDWYVLITDVVESTQAIADGRYKDVNLLGASSIIAVLNETQPLEIPFSFGGDGASLVVPPACIEVARKALLGVRAIARQSFGTDLRVGVVPVAEISQYCALKVAKVRLAPSYYQASFVGGGITLATDLIKGHAAYRLDAPGDPNWADLSGLECRWQEVPSLKGQTLSIIVTALSSSGEVDYQTYKNFLTTIQTIYGGLENYHPISSTTLNLSLNPRKLNAEVKLRATSTSRWARLKYLLQILTENLLGLAFMKFKLNVFGVQWGEYKNEVQVASDHQKIDDVLRMVISSRPDQTQQLVDYLEQASQTGKLAYGLHISDRAMLTCLILDRRSHHFHLVDGADGGYAIAAKHLKNKLKAKANNWKTYASLVRRSRSPQRLERSQAPVKDIDSLL
jgi:hypothetical protein